MLVLSRRLNEKIVIPSLNIIIQIVAVKPGVVRIGIQAPPEISIIRAELLNESVLDCPNDVPASDRTPAPSRKLRVHPASSKDNSQRAPGFIPAEVPPQ